VKGIVICKKSSPTLETRTKFSESPFSSARKVLATNSPLILTLTKWFCGFASTRLHDPGHLDCRMANHVTLRATDGGRLDFP
jgi:hypothetical protein